MQWQANPGFYAWKGRWLLSAVPGADNAGVDYSALKSEDFETL